MGPDKSRTLAVWSKMVYQLITVVINGINRLEYVPMHIKRSYREGWQGSYI